MNSTQHSILLTVVSTPEGRERILRTLARRSTQVASGCIEMTGYADKNGYCSIKIVHGVPVGAHRASFLANGGTLTAERPFVLHSCHNPRCVNPAHLRAGSQLENEQDKVAANRQARGSRIHCSKLTDAKVERIHGMLKAGKTKTAIAGLMGVARQTIQKIQVGLTWGHIHHQHSEARS